METTYGQTARIASLEVVQSELTRDERLIWSGQPVSGIRFQPEDLFMIPFSIMWAGFAFFWETTVLLTDAPFFFKLWGIPFVLVGLYTLFGRFVIDSIQRKRTYYALTSRRVVIITTWPGKNIQSLMLHTLPDITLSTGRGGRGTITFGSPPFGMPFNTTSSWPGMKRYRTPAFALIEDAREVYDLIKQTQMDAGRAAQESEWSNPKDRFGQEQETGASTRAL